MKELREQFQKETGYKATVQIQRYAGDQFGPEEFSNEYVAWLEKQLTESQAEVERLDESLELTQDALSHELAKNDPELQQMLKDL